MSTLSGVTPQMDKVNSYPKLLAINICRVLPLLTIVWHVLASIGHWPYGLPYNVFLAWGLDIVFAIAFAQEFCISLVLDARSCARQDMYLACAITSIFKWAMRILIAKPEFVLKHCWTTSRFVTCYSAPCHIIGPNGGVVLCCVSAMIAVMSWTCITASWLLCTLEVWYCSTTIPVPWFWTTNLHFSASYPS